MSNEGDLDSSPNAPILNSRVPRSDGELNYVNHSQPTYNYAANQTTSQQSNQDRVRTWQTQIGSVTDCLKDEQSLWYTIWCCWIVNARNVHIFGLGESFRENCYAWVAIIAFIVLFLINPILGLCVGPCILVGLAWRRAQYRTVIRQKYSIPGTFSDDLMTHTFCSMCAICQEAREAKLMNLPPIDFCFGEPLLLRETAYETAVEESSSSSSSACTPYLESLSKTSKFIIVLWGSVALLTIFVDLIQNDSANVLILFLVFLQPVAILYVLYWRQRRQFAYLDYVIKTFAYGFWFSTFQSAILESILQGAWGILVMIVAGTPPPSPSSYEAGNATATTTDDILVTTQKDWLKSHLFLVVVSCLFMAYVVAAGVEETMKHFVVRCCQFPSPLKDPHSILVYLVAAALGFATAENIEYVYAGAGGGSGLEMLEGELLTLLMRILTPVHVICAVLQAARYAKVLMSQLPVNLFQVLLPALLLHGTFDFVLFLLGALGYIYNWDDFRVEIASAVYAVVMALTGSVVAYLMFRRVETEYREGWQAMPDDDIVTINNNL